MQSDRPLITMKCITLWQPWASLIALLVKRYETRSWFTGYRGELAIHAAKRPFISADGLKIIDRSAYIAWLNTLTYDARLLTDQSKLPLAHQLPLGSIVALTNLVNCLEMWDSQVYGPLMPPHRRGIDISTIDALEKAVGDWQEGRFAWELDRLIKLPEPIPAKGAQGLWTPKPELINQLILHREAR